MPSVSGSPRQISLHTFQKSGCRSRTWCSCIFLNPEVCWDICPFAAVHIHPWNHMVRSFAREIWYPIKKKIGSFDSWRLVPFFWTFNQFETKPGVQRAIPDKWQKAGRTILGRVKKALLQPRKAELWLRTKFLLQTTVAPGCLFSESPWGSQEVTYIPTQTLSQVTLPYPVTRRHGFTPPCGIFLPSQSARGFQIHFELN